MFKSPLSKLLERFAAAERDELVQVFPGPAVRDGEVRVQMASDVFERRIAHSTITVSGTVVDSELVGPCGLAGPSGEYRCSRRTQ